MAWIVRMAIPPVFPAMTDVPAAIQLGARQHDV